MLSAHDFGGWEQGAVGENSAQSADGCWHAVSSGVLDTDSVSGETSGASCLFTQGPLHVGSVLVTSHDLNNLLRSSVFKYSPGA